LRCITSVSRSFSLCTAYGTSSGQAE
jgi:hypothetical protein